MSWKALSAHPFLARCCGDKGQVQAAAEILVTLGESCGTVWGFGNNWDLGVIGNLSCVFMGMWSSWCCDVERALLSNFTINGSFTRVAWVGFSFFFFKALSLNLLWQTDPCSSRRSHQLTGKCWLGFGLTFPWKLCHCAGAGGRHIGCGRATDTELFVHFVTNISCCQGEKKKKQNPKLWVINLSSNLYCARFRGCVRLCLLSKLPCTGSWELLALSKDKAEMERYPSLGITGKRSSSGTLPKRGLCEHCCRNSLSFG